MALRTMTVGVLLVLATWALAWKVASDRAEREVEEARARALAEEIASNRAYAARMGALAEAKKALDANAPSYARILPMRGVATEEKLLASFGDMAEASRVNIQSVEVRGW